MNKSFHMQQQRIEDWEELYKNSNVKDMPWFKKDLDDDLKEELKKRKITSGSFLDLCTGPGTQAISLSKVGFKVTGIDISESAIKKARKLSNSVDFKQADMLNPQLNEKFDYILDRGCFHVLNPEKWKEYITEVKRLLKDNGLLFLKCFSEKEPGDYGPRRLSKEDIKEIFSKDFEIESINEAEFRGTHIPSPKALFCVMKKLK